VYDKDPEKHTDAVMYESLDFLEVLKRKLRVMDATAISLCMEQNLPIRVFNVTVPGNLPRVAFGEKVGTVVSQ
jgi:uridylate kinase